VNQPRNAKRLWPTLERPQERNYGYFVPRHNGGQMPQLHELHKVEGQRQTNTRRKSSFYNYGEDLPIRPHSSQRPTRLSRANTDAGLRMQCSHMLKTVHPLRRNSRR
jgi:hypothetical protein